jgi:hypothetical protein
MELAGSWILVLTIIVAPMTEIPGQQETLNVW